MQTEPYDNDDKNIKMTRIKSFLLTFINIY